jgi:3-oxoacyl-[acyl-carrier-protein] synthase II
VKKVVITGMGAITPLGMTLKETWDALKAGKSGISFIQGFDTAAIPCSVAGELKGFDAAQFIPYKDIRRLAPFIHYAVASAVMAYEDSGLSKIFLPSHLIGVIIGSSRGGTEVITKAVENSLIKNKPFSAYLMPSTTLNMSSSYISMRLKLRGPSFALSNACASGTNAIGEAVRIIQTEDVVAMLAGGAEAPLCPVVIGGYGAAGALCRESDNPQRASRPFDAHRNGFVLSEGAATLVLEDAEHALKRNATIYGEIVGYGMSTDAYHQTRPHREGEAAAMKKALKNASISPDDIDYINAHGTSTISGDITETEAIKEVFGKRVMTIPVSSIKSMLGHMLGAAGAVETAITALSLKEGIIAPTINLTTPDPRCDLDYVPFKSRKADINMALTNSFGFGGVNASIIIKKFCQENYK